MFKKSAFHATKYILLMPRGLWQVSWIISKGKKNVLVRQICIHFFKLHCHSGTLWPLLPANSFLWTAASDSSHHCVVLASENSLPLRNLRGLPCGAVVKNLLTKAGEVDLTHGSGRSPGEGDGNPLQYSFLEKPMERGAWQATVQGVTKSRTWLSTADTCTHKET